MNIQKTIDYFPGWFIKLGVICLLFISTTAFSSVQKPNIDPVEFKMKFSRLANDNGLYVGSLRLNSDIVFPVELEGTSKGNGTLKIHNLLLRLYDQHDDGIVYEGGSLLMDIKDITNDGIGELIISGIVKFTGDNETDPPSYQPMVYIYTLDCSKGYFTVLYKTGEFSPELTTDIPAPFHCR